MCAMEERIRNTVIRAKQEGLEYMGWLCKYVGESDYEAEFVEPKVRQNLKWHARFDAYSALDAMTHEYTDPSLLNIDLSKSREKQNSFQTFDDLQHWLDSEEDAVIVVSPCNAEALCVTLRNRLANQLERATIRSILDLPDWAHFEVSSSSISIEGKVGVAVDLLDALSSKGDALKRESSTTVHRVALVAKGNKLVRHNSLPELVHLVDSGVFDFRRAESIRYNLYKRCVYDSSSHPIWRRDDGVSMRMYLHARMNRCLVSKSRRAEPEDDDSEDDELTFTDKGHTVDVKLSIGVADQLVALLRRLLFEVDLAFPQDREEFLRHAGLITQGIYLTACSELGQHIISAQKMRNVTLPDLLFLLETLTNRDSCIEECLNKFALGAKPSLALSAILEPGPVLQRFSSRIVIELTEFARRTVKAYEASVSTEGRGPCYESEDEKWWSRCPEDMMAVAALYVESAMTCCQRFDLVLGKVLAAVLAAFNIHALSVGKQCDDVYAAWNAFKGRAHNNGRAKLQSAPPPMWSGDSSLQVILALLLFFTQCKTHHGD